MSLKDKFSDMPKYLIFFESILLLCSLSYLICALAGQFFGAYFSAMGVLIIGLALTVAAAVKKTYPLAIADFLLSGVVFFHFVSIQPY